METTLTELDIKILMRCQKETISRRMATQYFKSAGKLERDKVLANLIQHGFLLSKRLPKPGARKTPTFYELTKKGKTWLKDYFDNYPCSCQ